MRERRNLPLSTGYLAKIDHFVEYLSSSLLEQLILDEIEPTAVNGHERIITNSILFANFGKTVLPFGLQIESRRFERIGLLLDAFLDHLPEAVAHSKAQVTRRRLGRFKNAITEAWRR